MEENEPNILDEQLEEADQRSAELEGIIGGDISPEMLANMDPVQLQALLSQMQGVKKRDRSYYTRKQIPATVRRKKRKAAKAARKVSLRNGGGRTISRRRRAKKAA